MPIRRAATTPTQEKFPSAAAEKEPDTATEETPSADEEHAASSAAAGKGEKGESSGDAEPEQNGEKNDEEAKKDGDDAEKELKDGYKSKKKAKKVKRTIPAWASVTTNRKIPVTNFAGTQNKVDNMLIEAIMSCNEKSGLSYQSVLKYIVKNNPGVELNKKKFFIKKALKKHLEKGTIKQVKGQGLKGTFAIGKQPVATKKAPVESLGDALPLIITRLCEPKEASYILIKKYVEQHFPGLNVENRPDVLKAALVRAVERGQLEQITGKGASGTFQLKRVGSKVLMKGGALEDAITAAITAMNEPKTCSTTTLRKYLVDANKDKKEYQLVAHLRRTLTKCKVLGWMEQITGHGFNGTYRLSFPFYPSPTILYPDKFKEPQKTKEVKRRQTVDSDDEESEEEEEEEDEESEDEAPPPKKRRPQPKSHRPPPAKKSKSRSSSKAKAKGSALAKKSPAKKVAPKDKKPAAKAKKQVSKEESPPPPPPKTTPVKRGSPAKKPKTPAVKKLTKRGSKRGTAKDSSSEEPAPEREMTRSASKRQKAEESSPEEPAAKRKVPKGGSKKPEPEESPPRESEESSTEEPVSKRGAKGSKKATRKTKRGKI
ncbi:heterochromatin protein 1-binding protein 3 isoform X2 [Thalassophryne amazonica]|uniref:heterochromatin protein 1-binding protein 3 isoform X2 n=1 Tax=Thalassophryne amazonica TaxID=390379 RepID=UPI00147190D6|nr:heterochromatin protein 1-binding protein 3 isoform X2 [Thalassophryne amazonica]